MNVVHVPLEADRWQVKRDWARLDEVTLGVWDCPHSTPTLTGHGPFVVRSQDVREGFFKIDEAARVSEETYQERIERAEPTYGDIFYSREGTYFGIAAEMPRGLRICLGQRMVLIRPDPAKVDKTFLRLWLNSPILTRHIHGFRDGTVAERLNMPTIRGLPVPKVLLHEQRRISELLGSLDDKIELNRRMNETLEALAQAIFRDWFVDFGPTRRKMEGATDPIKIMGGVTQNTDEAARLAALFPTALADNGLPEGWKWSNIGSQACTLLGGTPSRSRADFWSGDIPWINSGKANEFRILTPSEQITKLGLDSSATKLLPRRTTVIAITGATLGQVSLTEIETCANQSIVGVIDSGRLSSAFLYYWIKENIDVLVSKQTGGAQQHINKGNVEELPVIIASSDIFVAFGKLANPLLDHIASACFESLSLAAMRDLLLPKLMSGEIRLKDAEKIAEAAE
ncbi:MAG: restriction endonuclease subunit S [Pseudomonadota bacterium]